MKKKELSRIVKIFLFPHSMTKKQAFQWIIWVINVKEYPGTKHNSKSNQNHKLLKKFANRFCEIFSRGKIFLKHNNFGAIGAQTFYNHCLMHKQFWKILYPSLLSSKTNVARWYFCFKLPYDEGDARRSEDKVGLSEMRKK